jgi:prepilin-type N-terminal cleavage/methylation domain-containing protein
VIWPDAVHPVGAGFKFSGWSADELEVVQITSVMRKLRDRLGRDDGYTLVELITVMAILGIVLAPLSSSFASGMVHQESQTRREQAYANARVALQRLRLDIHCANGVTSVEQNLYGGFTLTMTESNDQSPSGWCPAVIPAGAASSGVQWCTVPYPGSTTRFDLYRFLGTNPTDCNGGSGSTFETSYLAAQPGAWPTNSAAVGTSGSGTPTSWVGNLWPTSVTCQSGYLPTLSVDLNVNVDPVNHPNEHYEMMDSITLRNAPRCT